MAVIGLLHPGEMGAAVGACLVTAGHTVLWDPAKRSPATADRAGAAGLTPAPLASITSRAEVIMSVCPPHAALEVAGQVATAGFRGAYVDANAVSPGTAAEVREAARGASYVDGGIVGAPPVSPGTTRLYLSGDGAQEIGELFAGTVVEVRVLTAAPYAASALKLCYASWTKGSAALLLAARDLARAEGVDEDLLAEWRTSQPDLLARWERAEDSRRDKGWRWSGEMEEIAADMRAHGLPDGFHHAAAQIFSGDYPSLP
jgi:3-hydroxyisobutyrate dehydrogenase-like beta-hydroxyacid dehydrogenase